MAGLQININLTNSGKKKDGEEVNSLAGNKGTVWAKLKVN